MTLFHCNYQMKTVMLLPIVESGKSIKFFGGPGSLQCFVEEPNPFFKPLLILLRRSGSHSQLRGLGNFSRRS